MKINKKDFVTEIRDAVSVDEILDNAAELSGNAGGKAVTNLLMVFGGAGFRSGTPFPADIPFITAFAAEEPEAVSPETRAAFDLVIAADTAEEYTEKLFKDKTAKQISEINRCFITARTGTQEDVLNCESRAFYRLMAEKNGGEGNE